MYRDHLEDMINFFNAYGVYESKHINQAVIDRYIRYSQTVAKNKNITINKRIGILTAMLKRTAITNPTAATTTVAMMIFFIFIVPPPYAKPAKP